MLSSIKSEAGHVLVVGRGDCKVLILGTSNAKNRLVAINGASPLEHDVRALETEHYRAIERDLALRFRAYREDGLGQWVTAEFEDVVKALDEYDADTGARKKCGPLELGERAWVHSVGKGDILGFVTVDATHDGPPIERVVVRMDATGQPLAVPRQYVKPVLRVAQ